MGQWGAEYRIGAQIYAGPKPQVRCRVAKHPNPSTLCTSSSHYVLVRHLPSGALFKLLGNPLQPGSYSLTTFGIKQCKLLSWSLPS